MRLPRVIGPVLPDELTGAPANPDYCVMRLRRGRWLAPLLALACANDRTPRNDTVPSADSPPAGGAASTPASTWDARAGPLFAFRSNGTAWLVNPAWGQAQALDTLTPSSWDPAGQRLTFLDGAAEVGEETVAAARFDSTCAGWPAGTLAGPAPAEWRVAFPTGRVNGIAFDSLPDLSPADSAARAREGALAASRLPGDTATAFRGRPFIVRQATRFAVAADMTATLFEVVRLVAQEANPLEEKTIIITESAPAAGEPRIAWHERVVALEEAMPSLELLAVLRLQATGTIALLVRREREAGFVVEWIERLRSGAWRIRWRSALDGC